MPEYKWMSTTALVEAYRSFEISPVDVVLSCLSRIEETNLAINAMVTVTANSAMAEARVAEELYRQGGDLPPLLGVPITVKDLTDTAGVRTTYGSQLYEEYVPEEDAIAWERLKQAGAILVGKTTTPEFGLLGITASLLTGLTSTPWKIGFNSGGSSGGSAASVSAGIVPISWGSDGGGSIRVPAALCGVVGIKPTTGMIPMANNEDPDSTEGPIATSVLDAAILLDITHGRDVRDRFSIPKMPVTFADSARAEGDLSGLKIGFNVDLNQGYVDPEIVSSFMEALDVLRELGAEVTQVKLELPDVSEFFIRYWGPEFIKIVDEFDEAQQPVWEFTRKIAQRAQNLSLVESSNALRSLKTQLYNEYARLFYELDAIVTPTTPIVAKPHPVDADSATLNVTGPIREEAFQLHRLTEPPSHAGLPAITLPCGFTAAGLPIGLQIITPMYEDARGIYVASRFEQQTSWHLRHPQL